MDTNLDLSCTLVIFGATGDLTHRKLLPAIYNLQYQKLLPESFIIMAIGRKNKTSETYREEAYKAIKSFSRFPMEKEIWDDMSHKIYYKSMDFLENEKYVELESSLKSIDDKHNTKGNRIYYMAVAPENFEPIIDKLHSYVIKREGKTWHRVVIEKPFGKDLESAQYLNSKIVEVFQEKNTYRIDHYLGKEMLQNIMVLRFANMFFEPLWNSKYIDSIQISSSEKVGVEDRGGYYEKAGAMRDMVQSHMLQLVSLIGMEPPNDLDTESIRNEKVKVLKALKKITQENIEENTVRGQYGASQSDKESFLGYREENRVSAISDTETYVALKVFIENFRWAGVPFYIRTGKRMPEKSTEIIIQFKSIENILYFKEKALQPNLLVIRIQPKEGVFFQFNAKEPGTQQKIIPVQMDFCQNCRMGINSPEAYERLIYDVMRGDSTLFARWDEVEYSWRFVDNILEAWRNQKPDFPNYGAGTWGPKEADILLNKDKRSWINI
ncbi:glucose-6-phosphate 1-dehydrogenase Zwf [Clostridium aceticum]|uniref:Glucose-6-phosphate 1-dehydrogenase n=1 Tax=Clostridium aceticum TaxID=84022 RepID=A0A0D8I8Z5_9CLOT|nr:glucose-6-phosphate dehydrogenase [Clostridium aceticum]AKL95678.1 glucose-6-phosphate 1-dehydrogenase Zwf [Clostridium aceticum]KJF26760.1 glucose-6-phosphate dehydrogenase [Clostridium aceticum]